MLATLALALIGIAAAGYFHGLEKDRLAAAEAQAAKTTPTVADPFANIPDEAPPGTVGKEEAWNPSRSVPTPAKAENEFADERWEKALVTGVRGEKLATEARAAKARDDYRAFQEKGKAAKEAFDLAFTLSVEFETEMLAAHGEDDPRVVRMLRIRDKWQDEMRVFHRTTGR